MARRDISGYESIVVIMPDDSRKVRKCELPSPPPEDVRWGDTMLKYIGTIWETPHYRVRAEA